ncbi:MAG TPA: FAD-dependent oxidoreductase [Gemmatimonadaceae bacterium]|nr:FAD-dependent oxidoreductase [Gemmatimonadaceae bacterium]
MNQNPPVWGSVAWAPLPRLESNASADVCVVGLGGSGLTCVNELVACGASVIGIDASTVADGAAGRNGGFLLAGIAAFYHDAVASMGRERARGIYCETLDELDRIAFETPDHVRRVGSLRIAASAEEEADCHAQYVAMRADDLPVELYDGPEGRGLLMPTDAAFEPLDRCRALATNAIGGGARLYEHTAAIAITGNEVLVSTGARVSCRCVVVAVDGNLEGVFPELSNEVRSVRLQMAASAPDHNVTLTRPVFYRYGLDYWQQLSDGRVVLGGGRDVGEDDEWTTSVETTEKVQRYLDDLLRNTVGVSATVTHRWAATVSFTRNSPTPLLKEVRQDVWVIGAYSGTGNVVGALYGRRAAGKAIEILETVSRRRAAV